MEEVKSTRPLDVMKVFKAIAINVSRRGEANVHLVGVRKVSEDVRKAG